MRNISGAKTFPLMGPEADMRSTRKPGWEASPKSVTCCGACLKLCRGPTATSGNGRFFLCISNACQFNAGAIRISGSRRTWPSRWLRLRMSFSAFAQDDQLIAQRFPTIGQAGDRGCAVEWGSLPRRTLLPPMRARCAACGYKKMLSLIAASDKAVLLVGSPVTKKRTRRWSVIPAAARRAISRVDHSGHLIETGSAIYER